MRRMFLVVVLLWLVSAIYLTAQDADPWSPSAQYDRAVPTPESVLGYKIGKAFTHYPDLISYYQRLVAASDLVQLEPYGKTFEGRTLYLVAISSAANLARLEQIRANTARLSDPRTTSPQQAEQIISETPAIVYLSYNVHGNESVSSEAAMQVAYELAASQDPRVLDWLDKLVVVLDPIVNPDGRERYVHFYRSTRGSEPRGDRFAAEHDEPWPGGRYNHYLFDLNRDWSWQSQQESRARVRAYRSWNPQVHVDYHEMGASSTYYFAPPAQPILTDLAPLLKPWFQIYGRANAEAFDRYGFRYFTRETYDLFYPGYGDSWPSLNGAVGMTYEQAGGGVAGLKLELPEGERVLTLRDRAVRHFTSSLATIAATAEHGKQRLRDYYEFHRLAIQKGQEGPLRQFYIPPGKDSGRVQRLVTILLRQGIEVQQASEGFTARGTTDEWGEKSESRQFPAGTYVVDTAQPAGFLVRALLQRDVPLNEHFFYDVTAWSLPLALGINVYSSASPSSVSLERVSDSPANQGSVEGSGHPVAYVFSWEQSQAVPMLAKLLKEDFKAYVALQAFESAGQKFSRGAIVVPVENNPAILVNRIRELAEESGCRVSSVSTQLGGEGIDLGSRRVHFLRPPRIAVLMDSPVSASEYGAVWHYLEVQAGIPFTPIRVSELSEVNLNEYNVMILPDDARSGRGYASHLGDSVRKDLKRWVEAGGVLIGIRGGSVFATRDEAGLTEVSYRLVRRRQELSRLKRQKKEQPAEESGERDSEGASAAAETPASQPDRRLTSWDEREKEDFLEEIPGAILRVQLDSSHPLAFGYVDRLAVLNRTAPILGLSPEGENVAHYPKNDLRVSGFISEENQQKLAGTAYLVREQVGDGQVILFADSPLFRGFWDGTARLLVNAIYFGDVTNPLGR